MNKKKNILLTIIVILLIIATGVTSFILGYNYSSKEEPTTIEEPKEDPSIEPIVKQDKTDYQVEEHYLEEIEYSIFEDSSAILGIAKTKEDYQTIIANNSIVFSKENNIENKSYDKYNYILIVASYDDCSEELTYNNTELTSTKTTITIDVSRFCGLCTPLSVLYEIAIPKDTEISENIEVKWNYLNEPYCDQDIAYKPVLYL